jgi:hypothetical protein
MHPQLLIDWLCGVRLTSQNRCHHWPVVHPQGERERGSCGDDDVDWVSLLTRLPELYGSPSSRDIWREWEEWMKEWEFPHTQYLWYVNGSLTCRKILRHGAPGFTSHPKEGVLRMFINLKNPSPRPGFNPRPLGLVASTLTTTPPRRHLQLYKLTNSSYTNNNILTDT